MSRVRTHHYAYIAAALFLLLFVGVVSLHAWQYAPPNVVATCGASASSSVCYSERIKDVLAHDGLGAALDLAAYAYAHDAQFASNCHGEMHVLGNDAYALFAQHKAIQLSDKASACGYGFYHGFMVALLYATHNYDEARAFCAYAGRQVPYPEGYAEGACYHGIGHGFTDGADSSALGDPAAVAAPGLDICHKVASSSPSWKYRCYSGVFNSMAIWAQDPKFTFDLHGDPYVFCKTRGYERLEREACYAEMNTLVSAMSKRDVGKALSYIDTIVDEDYRTHALEATLGVFGSFMRESPDLASVVAHACARYGTSQQSCVGGFVSGMLEMGSPGLQEVAVLKLCGAGELTAAMRAACYTQLLDVPQIPFSKVAIEKMCKAVPPEYRAALETCTTP